MANINLFALGGQDENGKNLFVIEVENDIYIINSGIKFPINDRWGVDGIITDTTYLQKNSKRIKGLFITHAHDENFAALPWLLMDIPNLNVYGSPFTVEVAKKRVEKYRIEKHSYKFHEIKGDVKLGSVNIKSFSAATSIPGALIYNFQTKDGDIVFMSNFILDDLGIFGHTSLEDIKSNSKNILALITDSRRANYVDKPEENKSVQKYAEATFKSATDKQRIIFGSFDEEMYNTMEIIKLANKYDRPVAFYGSAFDNLYRIMLAKFPNTLIPKKLVDYRAVNTIDNVVILVTGTWSRLNERFNRIALKKDVYLKFKPEDKLIMYTPPVNGMEVEYSQALDEITKIAPDILSITDKMVLPLRQTKSDIKKSVEILKPKFFMPTGSLFRYQKEATKVAFNAGVRKDRGIIAPNGRIIYLKDGEIASQNGVIKPNGDVIIQGYGVGDVSFEVIKERKNLSAGGLISIVTQYSRSQKELVGEIQVQIVGVVVKNELKSFQEEVRNIVIQKFEGMEKFDYRELQNTIRKRVKRVFMKKVDKEPLVVVTFYEV